MCVGLLALWWHWSHAVSDFTPPTPVLPTPNAHDTYVAAGKMLRHERKISFAVDYDLPTTKLGRSFYTQDNHPYTLAQKRQLVAENRDALSRLRLGLQQTYFAPPIRSFQTRIFYYRSFHSLSQLLLLEQQDETARGEWANAVNTGLDAIAFGESIARGAGVAGKIAGGIYAAPCRSLLWPAIAHLSGSQARMAAQRLENILSRHVAYADALQEDKWWYEGGLLEILHSNNLLNDLANVGVKEYEGLEGKSLLTLDGWRVVPRSAPFLLAGKRGAIVEYARYMDQSIANARLPYDSNLPELSAPLHPLNLGAYAVLSMPANGRTQPRSQTLFRRRERCSTKPPAACRACPARLPFGTGTLSGRSGRTGSELFTRCSRRSVCHARSAVLHATGDGLPAIQHRPRLPR